MSAAIGESAAWDLVLAVPPGSVRETRSARVHLDSAPDTWLEVAGDGTWDTSGEPTVAARDLVDLYLPVRLAPEIVIGQLGQSLDGRIATEGGASRFVTGPEDIERVHRLRALVDAVIVGAETVALDDPRLTVRHARGPDPVRVVLDPGGRLDGGLRVFSAAGRGTLVVRGRQPEMLPGDSTAAAGHEELRVPWSEAEGLDLRALLGRLRGRGLRRILVEGGGVTVSGFLREGLLDRLHLTVAPVLIGSGRPSITLDPIASLDEAIRPACRRFTLGEDVLFDLDLRAPRT